MAGRDSLGSFWNSRRMPGSRVGLNSAQILAFWPVVHFKMWGQVCGHYSRTPRAAEFLFSTVPEHLPSNFWSVLSPHRRKKTNASSCLSNLLSFFSRPPCFTRGPFSSSPNSFAELSSRQLHSFSHEEYVFGHCICAHCCANTMRTLPCPCLNLGILLLRPKESFVGI